MTNKTLEDRFRKLEKRCCCSSSGAGIVELTYAEAAALKVAETIVPGATYKITDRGDRGIFLTGLTTTEYSIEGERIMLCPKTYATDVVDGNNWLGVWHSGLAPSAGDLVIWGGHVWSNDAGNVGASVDIYTLDTEWTLIAKTSFTNNEYIEMPFGVYFDFDNDWIEKQFDTHDNVLGLEYVDHQNTYTGLPNFVDVSDWNYSTQNVSSRFFGNKAVGILNNRGGHIHQNVCTDNLGVISGNMSAISANYIQGGIFDNDTDDIWGNYIFEGDISGNIGAISIYHNVCTNITDNIIGEGYEIKQNFCEDISGNEFNGDIKNNHVANAITGNLLIGDNTHIEYNYCKAISGNTNEGPITKNHVSDVIYNNSHSGSITSCVVNGVIQGSTGSGGITNIRSLRSLINIVVTSVFTYNLVESSAGTLTIYTEGTYVATGTTSTFSLPTPTGSSRKGTIVYIKNRGSGNLTVNVTGGGSTIYTTAAVASITIAPGDGETLIADTTYWNLI